MSTIALPKALSEWVGRTYPNHPYAYWGQSGAALLWDALLQTRRKTIVMPAFICPSLPAAAVAAGLRVVFVDVDLHTLLPTSQRLEECLAAHADEESVLLVDHSFGYPLAALKDIRHRHPRLLIIEDCARALGSRIQGELVGQSGDWTLLSMYKTVPGNNHGAVFLAREPLVLRSGPAPKTTLRQWASTLGPLRFVHGWAKRRRPDFIDGPRTLAAPQWTPAIGVPNRLCLRRFAGAVARLDDDVARRQEAAAVIRAAFADLPTLRFVLPAAGCETTAYFLSFMVADTVDRNELLTRLHRRGFFLLRTWDITPAHFGCFAHAFLHGAKATGHLADHIGHIPVARFIAPTARARFIHCFRKLLQQAGQSAARNLEPVELVSP